MSGASRHVACKLCRDRKVRCDGGQPRCQRCTRSGDECVYTPPSKQQKNGDLQQTVELLKERLSQAEAALSLHQASATTTDAGISSASDNPGVVLDTHVTTPATFNPDTLPDNDSGPVCFDFDLLDFDASLLVAPHVPPKRQHELLPDELLRENVQNDLSNVYFRLVDSSFPVLDRSDCPVTLSDPLASQETVALQLALFAHGALRCRAYNFLADVCYESARRALERVEVEAPTQSTNVTALQAYVLIALFEFRKEIFTRAIVSVKRVSWIARLLRLHHLDSAGINASDLDPREQERCRRAFWAVFMLGIFVRVDSCASPRMLMDEREISTLLPGCSPDKPIPLGDAYAMPDSGRLNPHQGLALSMAIAGQCISLANYLSCDKASSFLRCDFWTRHDQLNEIIDNARKHGLAHFHSSTVGLDAVALSIQALLYASELCLYETAKRKSRDISVGAGFQSTSRQRRTSAMLEFIQVANQVNHVDGNKLHPFTPWAVYVALQSCIRQLQRCSGEQQGQAPTSRPRSQSGPLDSTSRSEDPSDLSTPDPTFPQLLDWVHFLLSILSDIQRTNAFARAFEAEIRKEIEAGEDFARNRIVGLLDFPVVEKRYG
ncbi:transcriptional regulatory protein [Botryosphaeria dothidea]|uniref:Transcriptional regulatory protein n=1 Tax=Botryosphaeria dothidea TaxID=55169 RepID=A0A8H4IMQ2_9PEZI|nr:transcriptional regulatory protein [Botryosphaeria dothidea]